MNIPFEGMQDYEMLKNIMKLIIKAKNKPLYFISVTEANQFSDSYSKPMLLNIAEIRLVRHHGKETVIILVDGSTLIVQEKVSDIAEKIRRAFKYD